MFSPASVVIGKVNRKQEAAVNPLDYIRQLFDHNTIELSSKIRLKESPVYGDSGGMHTN